MPLTRTANAASIAAPNGEIYVADGHGAGTNDRIVKFSKDGKFITAWGKHGKGPGEFDTPHGIALDSTGRVYAADRAERCCHRQERHDLRRRFAIDLEQ